MSSGPARGPDGINGEERKGGAHFARRAVSDAVAAALPEPAAPAAGTPYPQLAFFMAREKPKMHQAVASTYELMWGIRTHELTTDGQGVGFTCQQGMPVRSLASALRVCADRLDEIALAVETGQAIPEFSQERASQLAAKHAPRLGGQSATAQPVDKCQDGAGPIIVGGQSTTAPGGTEPGERS